MIGVDVKMFSPEIGKCSKCGIDGKEIWPEYEFHCNDCFDLTSKSRYMIGDVPLVRVVEDLLMERPIVKKIIESAMADYGVHRILRLENDGLIYMAEIEKLVEDGGLSKAMVAAVGVDKVKQPDKREGVRAADPDLIPKLNKMIDDHLKVCVFCISVMEEQ